MIALTTILAVLAQAPEQATATTTAPPAVELAEAPADFAALPELPLQRPFADMRPLSQFVRNEVRAGRCSATDSSIRVDLAVLIAANGQVRRVRPRAIACPTVEQYASGVMSRMARNNVSAPGEDRWYRAALVFAWN